MRPAATPSRLAVLAAALVLAGCAGGEHGFPSLAHRPIEQLSTAEPETAPAPQLQAPDPALAARYADIVRGARAGDADFRKELALARSAAARGGARSSGSDAWIEAQQALTRLEAARAPIGAALAALDAERTSGVFDRAPLDAAVSEVQAIDSSEAAAVNAVAEPLGR